MIQVQQKQESTDVKNSLTRKLYYSISEVAKITQLQPYTLRAWEKEFSCLRPRRLHGKNRSYRARDIGIIILIKRLLYDERYTTQGASQKLKNEPDLVRHAAENTAFSLSDKKPEAPLAGGQEDAMRGSAGPRQSQNQERVELVASNLTETKEGPAKGVDEEAINALKRVLDSTRKELKEVLQLLS